MSFLHSLILISLFYTVYSINSKHNQLKNYANDFHLHDERAIRIEPEAYMTIEEIIKYHGYPVEVFDVITDDGYILSIHRIPHGKAGPGSKPRKPVMIQHGLLVSAASWVLDVPDKNLPYVLAEAGYDVWLGNIRGTVYGRRHLYLSPEKKEFWQFSFDEMAQYDIPAVIDFILLKTKYKQIYYIGHSMGTTMMFALLSTQPKYNQIVKTFFALAPVSRLGYVKTPLTLLAPFTSSLNWVLNMITSGELMTNSPLLKLLASTVCTSPLRFLCENVLFLLCGYNIPQLNSTRVPVYLHHNPAGTSVQTLVHYGQLVNVGNKFQKFDYGAKLNLQKYGQVKVPEYNLYNITTQVAVFYGDNDYLADPKDVGWLQLRLINLVIKYRVPLKDFSHLDFLWAIDVKVLLYHKLVEIMSSLWKD